MMSEPKIESPYRPKVRNCPLCGKSTIRARVEKPKAQVFWVNRDDHSIHDCQPKVKIYSKEEIERLNAERGLKSTTQEP